MAPNETLRPLETTAGCTERDTHTAVVRLRRLDWERLLSRLATNGFMITLGFRMYLDQARAIEVANHFLLRVNRRIYGKRFRRHSQSLVGAVVLEHKHHSTRSSKSPHFHFVVAIESFEKSVVDEDKLRVIVEHEAGRLCFPTLDYHQPLGPPVSGPDFVDVRRIENPDGLANYLTKDCKNFGPINDALNIGFIGMDGIEGI